MRKYELDRRGLGGEVSLVVYEGDRTICKQHVGPYSLCGCRVDELIGSVYEGETEALLVKWKSLKGVFGQMRE